VFEAYQQLTTPPLLPWVRYMLVLWTILFIPWPVALVGAGMSGEGGGNQVAVNALVWSVISYPVLVFVAFVFRRMRPRLVFLPALSLAVGFIAGLSI
jgi:hypothetical protein